MRNKIFFFIVIIFLGISGKMLIDRNKEKFILRKLSINGTKIISLDEIKNNIGVLDSDLLSLNPWKLKENIETLPMINSAQIIKKYPDSLIINIEEREPKILIKSNQKNYIIDKNNKVTLINKDIINQYPIIKALLYIEGDDILKEAMEISNLIIDKNFSKRITGLYRIGSRRWDMIIDHKIKVMLPEEIDENFIENIFNTIDQQKANNNIEQQAIFSILDMRIKSKLFIKNINE